MARYLLWLLLLIAPALAHVPGENPNSELYKWADRQRNDGGSGCCGQGDAHLLDTDHVRTAGGDYEVEIDGHWFRIAKPWFLFRRMIDPNPSGTAVVWYGYDSGFPNGIHIYCFAPPTLL